MHRRAPIAFRGAVTNLEASREFGPDEIRDEQRTADLRVFVDGQLRYARLSFGRDDGDEPFNISLEPGDRFLTIISGDDGDFNWDQVVLVDPVVVLATTPSETALAVVAHAATRATTANTTRHAGRDRTRRFPLPPSDLLRPPSNRLL